MWSLNAYRGYGYQNLQVPNGTYTLTAYVKSSRGQNAAYLEAKNYGGTAQKVNIPTTSTWVPITITKVVVSNGTATVGVYTDANAGNWLWIDRVQFYRPTWNQVGTAATNIAVDDLANPWVTNSSGEVWTNTQNAGWTQDTTAPANAVAIAGGTAGRVSVVTGSGDIYRRSAASGSWTKVGTDAKQIANDSQGDTWVINAAGQVWRYNGTWTQITNAPAGASAIAAGGDITLNNQPITVAVVTNSGAVWNYDGSNWNQIGTAASNVAVDSTGGTWVTNSRVEVWNYFDGQWTQNTGASNAVAIGAGNYGAVAYVDGAGVIRQN